MPGGIPQEVIDQFVGAAHGDLTTIRTMLADRPELLGMQARWHETPIQAAAHAGAREVAEFLLARGAPLEICTAGMLGMTDRVAMMLREDPALAHATGAHGLPVVYHAATTGQIAVAELLLAHGCDVNQGSGGNAALHAAARFGRLEMAAWLLDHGADVNVRDHQRKTPLQVAQEAGHADLAALLRARGGIAEGENLPR